MTLASNFKTPLIREYCLQYGLRSCERAACVSMLREPGAAIVLYPGGAAEALVTEQGKHKLVRSRVVVRHGWGAGECVCVAVRCATARTRSQRTAAPRVPACRQRPASVCVRTHPLAARHTTQILKRRKGFARIAVATGAHVVPVFGFGECDLFETFLARPGTLWFQLQRLSHRCGRVCVPPCLPLPGRVCGKQVCAGRLSHATAADCTHTRC
jgi:hypothetical protein